jgi:hypothetical protein
MKLRHGLALLFCLTIGCSRTPVSPSPSEDGKDKSSAVLPAAKPKLTPAPEKKHDPPVKGIAKPRDNPEIIRTSEHGIVRGIVRWEGAEPKPPSQRLRIDATTRGVAQTVVWLTPSDNKMKPVFPVKTVPLSTEQGEYQPHILLAQKGNTLELRTIEDRADFQASGAATFSATIQRGEWRTFPLSSPGLITVHSQLQPDRIPAYIWVLDSVLGTLSGKDGQFRLPPVGAGEYELVLWHEDWRSNEAMPPTARVRLSLGANDGAEVRWTMSEKR